jgi:PBP1b-binding outer membrane lipoprotein LpoB
MKFNSIYLFIFVFLFSCTQDVKIINKHSKVIEPIYSSKGFALIYEDAIFESRIVNKKLYNDQDYVLHPFLKNDTLVNISNPLNSKSLIAKIRETNEYPPIYSVVITKKMAESLDLDINNPYVELLTTKRNDKFIAKKTSTFEEEKKVASKAPVTSININNLSVSTTKNEIKKKKPLYIINIAEFYFIESAETVKNRFEEEANLEKIEIIKISENKFKVYSGPYISFASMKETYFSLNELGFENLDIIDTNK